MNTNEEMLTDISAELDKEFGAPGTMKKRMRSIRAKSFLTHERRRE